MDRTGNGTGKTLTTAFLAAQAQRFGARLFFFGKDRGLEMAVHAIGGRYNEIRAGVPIGLNPHSSETNERGRAWLSDWLSTLLSRTGELFGEQSRHIQSAVTQNATAGPALQSFSSFETLFQSIDVTGDIVGFDMTEILDMTTERMAVLSYTFRQIAHVVEDRCPTIILLDEAWKLLDDPYFGARLENWLGTLQKMNCVVIMMMQYGSVAKFCAVSV